MGGLFQLTRKRIFKSKQKSQTFKMNKLILLAFAATVFANNCTIDDSNPNQEYYLRFLPTTDYKNGFTTEALQKAKYLGYDESSTTEQEFFKVGTKSKFTVTKE